MENNPWVKASKKWAKEYAATKDDIPPLLDAFEAGYKLAQQQLSTTIQRQREALEEIEFRTHEAHVYEIAKTALNQP